MAKTKLGKQSEKKELTNRFTMHQFKELKVDQIEDLIDRFGSITIVTMKNIRIFTLTEARS